MKSSSRRKFIKTSVVTALYSGMAPLVSFPNGSHKTINKLNEEKGLVFLFQGDSITDGNRGRNADPNHIMGHGYAFAVASRIGADFPTGQNLFYNRGISGNKVPDLLQRWKEDAIELKPDVLSILVGINDTAAVVENKEGALDVAAFERDYRQLLTESKTANPNILFVLGIPFVYPVGSRKENWLHWQAETRKRANVVKDLAVEFNAVIIDYPAMFDQLIQSPSADYWVWDGIHPTVFGHEMMAREWIKRVSDRLLFLKHYT